MQQRGEDKEHVDTRSTILQVEEYSDKLAGSCTTSRSLRKASASKLRISPSETDDELSHIVFVCSEHKRLDIPTTDPHLLQLSENSRSTANASIR